MSAKMGIPSTPLRYVMDREMRCNYAPPCELMRNKLFRATNLFRKDLFSHYGCVNAIEYSNEGEWLISGGDDRRVLLWNVEKAIHGSGSPFAMKGEHSSNIFCLGFDNHNSKIFSAGNDEQVIVHDTRTGEPLDIFLHEEAVYGLSVDPLNDNVFASACDDGRVLIWDIREPSTTEPFCLASYSSAFHAVMYNPVEPRLLATANSKEGVSLWDVRQPKDWLMKYGSNQTIQSCMSVRFNISGTQILALRRRLPPILFNIHSQTHVCEFDHPGYHNSCTMKSCCFAGDNDQYVVSGSDDFNLYLWKIPEKGDIQSWVDEAHLVLKGHRSIVNQVRFNPSNFLLASSGVEKIVKLWSPFRLPGSSGGLTKDSPSTDKERKVYTYEEYLNLVMRSGQVMTHDYSHQSTQEDPRMMAFFDSLVQREIEGLTSDSSLSGGNSDSWLFNVAESVSLSDIDSSSLSSDGELPSLLGDVAVSNSNSNGARGFSPLTVSVSRGPGWNPESSPHEDQDDDINSDEDSRTRRPSSELANDEQGTGSTSSNNNISRLIHHKRQQLYRLRYQQTPAEQRSNRKSSEISNSTNRSTRAAANKHESTSANHDGTDSSSSSSSTSYSSSPSTPTSSRLLRSAADENGDKKSPNKNGHKKGPRSGKSREFGEATSTDRRKRLRKRRVLVLPDLTDSDTESDGELAGSAPLRKRICACPAEDGRDETEAAGGPLSCGPGVASTSGKNASPPEDREDHVRGSRKAQHEEGRSKSANNVNVTCVAVQETESPSNPPEENGETSGSAATTPDSGIASQKCVNGGHPTSSASSAASTSDLLDLAPARFKRFRSRNNLPSGQPRHYRTTSRNNLE